MTQYITWYILLLKSSIAYKYLARNYLITVSQMWKQTAAAIVLVTDIIVISTTTDTIH